MINENDFDDLDLDIMPINMGEIKDKIPQHSSIKLCEMIVCDRYFGCYKEMAILCMEELAKRRIAGDAFDFETYIEKSYNELPVIDIAVPDLGDVLRQIINRKVK